MAYSTKKSDRDNAVKETPENVRIREEAAARCTKVIKRRVLKESQKRSLGKMQFDARKNNNKKEPLSELYVNGNFMED